MSRELGKQAEMHAMEYLQRQGLTLVTENFYSRFGEIDLIMLDKEILVFVEVRCRKSNALVAVEETVNYRKQQRIIKTATYFIYTNQEFSNRQPRFDVLFLRQSGNDYDVDWLSNIF